MGHTAGRRSVFSVVLLFMIVSLGMGDTLATALSAHVRIATVRWPHSALTDLAAHPLRGAYPMLSANFRAVQGAARYSCAAGWPSR